MRAFGAAALDDVVMNSTTADADASPATLQTLEQSFRPVRVTRAVLMGGAAVGGLAAWALDGQALGVGFFVVTVAFVALLLLGSGREGRQSARGHRWLLAAAVLLAGFVAVRDSALLVALDGLAVVTLLLLAVRGWNGEQPVWEVTLAGLSTAPLSVVGEGTRTGAAAIGAAVGNSRLIESAPRLVVPAAKMALVGGPIVGLVTFLLAEGDAAFRAQLESGTDALIELPLPEATRMALVGLCSFTLATGLVAWALRRQSLARAPETTRPNLQLGLPEALAVLLGLTVVLALFGVVSTRCAFAPEACELPRGVTYSVYARRGFWELLAVAAIVLMTVLSVPHRLTATTSAARRAVRVAASALVVATLPMLLSAVNRMMLYEDVYGFTRQRVLSQAVCVFVGLLLVWRAVTLWTWPHRFAVGVVAAGALVLLGFNALNPDAFIARKNVERPGAIDAAYLRELSADAASVLRAVPAERLGAYDAALFAQRRSAPGSLASFNLARACDRAGGAHLEGQLCP